MKHVAVLGAGSWGTALAVTLARKGLLVNLWARRQEQVDEINTLRENVKYLPGVVLPDNIKATTNLEEALANTEDIVLAVPSHSTRNIIQMIKNYLKPNSAIINTAKGIEPETLLRLSQVAEEEIPGISSRFAVLSGPSHAEEVGKAMPTAVVVASSSRKTAERFQELFFSPTFRVYTNPDVIGVEVSGALKNVIALATGISVGLGFGDNTAAALVTRGMTEIARLGVKMGANPLTFAGLTGIGDLVVTCTSRHSRNRRTGIALGQGQSLENILSEMNMAVEGVRTTKAIMKLKEKYNVNLPISEEVYKVLFQGVNPKDGVINLMTRDPVKEIEEVVLDDWDW
ncbi:MAG: NAD(P)H-dependent glycerol-3-phosphate dehydrogenase [Clostridia bacterium]|jgi:glycerol-3-phosphate dehydrogenase (NAD(P)+)|nr:NAD(P)H-dependent glycerol-3-phosphate dehydrogenase [Clostridia bacterium]